MAPLVSIIIPAYNCEKFIKSTLNSCLDQSYQQIEVIIVDDGSTDGTANIINSYVDTRIKYYKIKNSGPCKARNFGISKANGTLFQFLDHDDILQENKIELQISNYLLHGDNYIYSGVMGSIVKDAKFLEKGFDFYYRNLNPEQYFRSSFDHFGKYMITGVWLVPKKLLLHTDGWNEQAGINDDGEFFSRVICLSSGIKFCKDAIFYFRRDLNSSLSKQFNSKDVYVKWLNSYALYVQTFLHYFSPKIAKELGRKALSVYYCNSYPNYPDLLKQCKKQISQLGYRKPVAYGGKKFKLLAALIGVESALKFKPNRSIRTT